MKRGRVIVNLKQDGVFFSQFKTSKYSINNKNVDC